MSTVTGVVCYVAYVMKNVFKNNPANEDNVWHYTEQERKAQVQ